MVFKMMRNWNISLRLLALCIVVVLPYYIVKKNWLEENEPQYKLVSVQDADTWFIGVSTMRMGLSPEHFIQAYGGARNGFNLAYHNQVTPYGPSLTSFLKKKFQPSASGQLRNLFVLEWRQSSFMAAAGITEEMFREADQILYKIHAVNSDPNIEFILRRKQDGYALALEPFFSKLRSPAKIILASGWGERRAPRTFLTDNEVKQRFKKIMRKGRVFSTIRMASFFELVDHLTACGEVIVLATPVREAMREVPVADEFIHAENILRDRKDVLFLDYSDWADRTDFADFNHLHREAAIRLSSDVGKKVRDLLGETM